MQKIRWCWLQELSGSLAERANVFHESSPRDFCILWTTTIGNGLAKQIRNCFWVLRPFGAIFCSWLRFCIEHLLCDTRSNEVSAFCNPANKSVLSTRQNCLKLQTINLSRLFKDLNKKPWQKSISQKLISISAETRSLASDSRQLDHSLGFTAELTKFTCKSGSNSLLA